ncbi:TonB-dependent receptor [Sphingomonas sp. FW199]|uniref:TonB-dependent receptor n=1 Tax=Sphingomonas sp. FW199 TaxID=3400217 RepID=UPI003CF1AF38
MAICAMAAAAPAFAQDAAAESDAAAAQDAPTGDDVITVTGIRASLANAQSIKRGSDTVVDAITAQDIGALPDRSVTEALQRIPGVSINRFAGSNDPDHFSVEGSGVVIRGLSYVRSEFNGRDTFSTGVGGQSINFADVPAELLGSVVVAKNLTAEMIEGGLSGVVDLRTRLPFDRRGLHGGFNLEANYGDLAKQASPTMSALLSNTWDTGAGTFGLLANVSYSQLLSRSDGIQVANFQTRDYQLAVEANSSDSSVQRCANPLPGNSDTQTLPGNNALCGTPQTAGADGLADWANLLYAPLGGQFRTQDYDRRRKGVALAGQWESLDRRAMLTAQFLRTEATQRWGEYTAAAAPDLSDFNTYPYGCRPNGNGANVVNQGLPTGGSTTRAECPLTGSLPFRNFEYDENGVFERGYITLPGSGWRSQDSGGTWRTPTGGMQQEYSRREVDEKNVVADYGLNFKFTPNDRWSFQADAQFVQARRDQIDFSLFGGGFADQELDISGKIPVVVNHKPLWLSADWAGATSPNGSPCPTPGTCSPNARINGQNDQQYFTDPGNYFFRAAMDHFEQSQGEEAAFRGDIQYNFDEDSFLKRLKVGGRYADRDQTVRYSNYNWGTLSETWGGNGPQWMDDPRFRNNVSFFSFDNFFRGATPGPIGGFYYNGDLIENYDQAVRFARQVSDAGGIGGSWRPAAQRANADPLTGFRPDEIQQVSERNINAYAMLSFDSDRGNGGLAVSGNIGVRFVDTEVRSVGAFTFPTRQEVGVADDFATRCRDVTLPSPPAPPNTTRPAGGICVLGQAAYDQVRLFADGRSDPNTAVNKYRYFLPSLNLKVQLTNNLIARFAGSRALARPEMNQIRNFFTFGSNQNDPSRLQGNAGNPFLKPAISDQFDVTLEWYFARVGSLTINGFYKDIKGFFYQNVIPIQLTNNGVTLTANVRQPDNFDGSGKVKGFEVAYQQTFDFLPGFLSGLGFSGSYTFIDSEGLPANRPVFGPATNLDPGPLPLEQLSRHNVNASVFYEKGPVSLRAAYNWRSRFLLTAADVIHPFYPIFNDETGQLDASAFFSLSPVIKVGVQGVNLLNETTRTLQQYTGLPNTYVGPRSYFINDRRFAFIVRGSF